MKLYDEKKHKNLSPDNFEFVQRDEKIYDKRFETKPIGYFKDAMIRFGKNRTNVIATIILGILIMLAIFVPVLTTKNYEDLETELANLPPRMPLLKEIGIFDGMKQYEDQQVDLTTIDPETGLGLPLGFDPDLIQMDTLKNYEAVCTDLSDSCVGGQVDFALDRTKTESRMQSPDFFSFSEAKEPSVTVDLEDLETESSILVNVNIVSNFGTVRTTLGTITEPGVYEYDLYDTLELPASDGQIELEIIATEPRGNSIRLNAVTVDDNTSEEPLADYKGFSLTRFRPIVAGSTIISRVNGVLLQSSFEYDIYADVFGEREYKVFSANQFREITEANADVCNMPSNPDDLIGWDQFGPECPFTRVVAQTEPTQGPDGQFYFSYHLFVNYSIYRGYDDIPNFLFGTNAFGKDFFALVWLGLRTSLFVGLVVATINISVGIIYGSIEGYYGGMVDLLMERFGEIIGRIPFLVWLGLFVIILGPGVLTLIVLLTITGWLGVASTTRTQFYRYKGREYVLASRTMGAKDSRIIFRHILPNGIGTIITASILMIPAVIFSESTISYLGYGIGHGQSFKLLGLFELSGVSIGVLLADGRTSLVDRPYLTMFPAVIISILMITFNMFGNALRDAFNPSLRGSE
jgi:oligopeptide transport system permease protein